MPTSSRPWPRTASVVAVAAAAATAAGATVAVVVDAKRSPMALCPNCNKMVTHKLEDCYSLEANKSKIPLWYKSCKTE